MFNWFKRRITGKRFQFEWYRRNRFKNRFALY